MAEDEKSQERRLILLESKVAFQEYMIDELNGVVTAQQIQIDRIEKELAAAHGQLKNILSGTGENNGY